MIAWKLKHWRVVGTAAALSLAACGGEGGEAGSAGGEGGEAGESGEAVISAPATPVAPAVAGAIAPGGEAGEAGVASAYAGLSADQLTALRIQHLRGFLMAAELIVQDGASGGEPVEAAVLVQQGLLEVYDPFNAEFGSLDVAPLRQAAEGTTLTRAQMQQRLRASQAALNTAMESLDVDHAILVARMVDIATGLYQHVFSEYGVDPIEYTHSIGAALAAREALTIGEDELRRENLGAYSRSLAELQRFVALWPSRTAPEDPATYQQVLVQSSRVRLALSPYL